MNAVYSAEAHDIVGNSNILPTDFVTFRREVRSSVRVQHTSLLALEREAVRSRLLCDEHPSEPEAFLERPHRQADRIPCSICDSHPLSWSGYKAKIFEHAAPSGQCRKNVAHR